MYYIFTDKLKVYSVTELSDSLKKQVARGKVFILDTDKNKLLRRGIWEPVEELDEESIKNGTGDYAGFTI